MPKHQLEERSSNLRSLKALLVLLSSQYTIVVKCQVRDGELEPRSGLMHL